MSRLPLALLAAGVVLLASCASQPVERSPEPEADDSPIITESPEPPSVDSDPDVARAFDLYSEGENEASVQLFDVVIKRHPGEARLLFGRARVRWALGDRRGAIADTTAVLEITPEDVFALKARSLYLQTVGDYAGALQDIDLALGLDPRLPDLWNNRAWLLLAMGKGDAAMKDAERAVALERNAATLDTLAWAQFHAGELEAASLTAIDILEVEPFEYTSLALLVRVMVILADQQTANRALKEYVEALPDEKKEEELFLLIDYFLGRAELPELRASRYWSYFEVPLMGWDVP